MRDSLLLTIACLFMAMSSMGCRTERESRMYDIYLENRHDAIVSTTLLFKNLELQAGGPLRPGAVGNHHGYSGEIPKKARAEMRVLPKGADLTSPTWSNHIAEAAVRGSLPDSDGDMVLYFIIEQDLSLRLIALPKVEFDALKERQELPR